MNIDFSTDSTSHQQTIATRNPLHAIRKASQTFHRSMVDRVSVLNEMGISKYEAGDFETSASCFSKAASELGIDLNRNSRPISPKEVYTSMSPVRYDEGMLIYGSPLKLPGSGSSPPPQLEEGPIKHITAAVVAFNMAQAQIKCQKLSLAEHWLHQALYWNNETNDHFSQTLSLKTLHCLGFCRFVSGKGDMAMIYYQEALDTAQSFQVGNQYVAASLNSIGVLLFNMDDASMFGQSLESFERCLKLYQSCGSSVDPLTIATVHNNLGRLYFLRSDFNKALQSYQQSLEVRRQLLGDNSIDVAATLYNIAHVYKQLGQFEESLEHYEAFLEIAKSTFGEDSKDVALVLKDIGEIHHARGNCDTALDFFHQALRAQTAVEGRMSLNVATLLNKIGNVGYQIQDYESSLAAYSEGLNIECAVLPPNHPHTIITLTNIAHIHKQLGEHEKALEAYERVLNMQVETYGSNSVVLAETISFMALMQYHVRDFPSALESYKFALRIYCQHYSDSNDDHPSIATTLNSMGLVLFKQKAYDLATVCFRESLRIRTKLLGPNHRDVAILWYNLATVHYERGDEETAITMYKETLRVERLHVGESHPNTTLTLRHLGQVYQQLGELEEAVHYYQQVVALERKRAILDRSALSKVLNLLGNVYLQLDRVPEMMRCYVAASRLNENRRESEWLKISGFNLYCLHKTNPPAAPVA